MVLQKLAFAHALVDLPKVCIGPSSGQPVFLEASQCQLDVSVVLFSELAHCHAPDLLWNP
jgi:hypothetical protein